MKNNKLAYITYQTFPASTANSLQTICNITEIASQGFQVELVFPNRDKKSSDNIDELKKYYNFKEDFLITRIQHNLPFGKLKLFEKLLYHLSHFLWAKKAVKNITSKKFFDIYITRSDWVFYFLSKQNKNVIFECHQPSKLRDSLLKRSLKKKNSKVIFVNEKLKQKYNEFLLYKKNGLVLENGYRDNFFRTKLNKNAKQVTFVGELLRFGASRNIEFILSCFEDERLSNYTLKIVGGPDEYVQTLKNKKNFNINNNIHFLGRKDHESAINIMLESEIGILLNTSTNIHSTMYTSPLKYYEYLAAGLKIIATDFESHRNLPFSENILFYNENDKSSFIESMLSIDKLIPISESKFKEYSIKKRVEKILNFARLEGLEPPTL